MFYFTNQNYGYLFYILDEDDDDDGTLIDPTLMNEEFLSDDDDVDFNEMMAYPSHPRASGRENGNECNQGGKHGRIFRADFG